MASSGYTTTDSLSDSLSSVVAEARYVRDFEGVMPQLVEKRTLTEGTGDTWNEVTLAKITATAITETTVEDNPQQLTDTTFPLVPSMISVETFITDKVRRRIARVAYQQLGSLGQNAIQRKKDQDGLIVLDGFSVMTGTGAGTTLTAGAISGAKVRISSNATEPGKPPYRAVLHGYQIHDIFSQLVSGIGTYPLPDGPSANVFKNGFTLPIAGVQVYEDGNITIDSASNAKGGVFAQSAIVLVQGKSPWTATMRRENIGGGGDSVFLRDEYVYGERLAGGTTSAWGYEIYTDATAPS